ncbi:hypothetical protein BCR37DRAFT_392932 [Protomyces lactucae-debilis]|uniref:protein disulfide-isomerase n=1 Tax=Protomyces lactucae-debilis TaxID=2754530 RepID=A0A1Y2FEZ9_PROLT|nr:uncharacterized protein BCR37DRAFT_392932 [Protomyces lactucae-debilis]ORY81876.1 hypothetical protein BCR37DRAFT_392932 [Protomyces lactucae-debilis]
MHLLLLAQLGSVAALYGKNSPVMQLDPKTFDAAVKQTSKISFVEFFAPWNLAPTYEKVAASLKGMVNFAAVDCDNDSNKPLCGEYQVQGFPTIKIMIPEVDKNGKHSVRVEDYKGGRTVAAIADFAVRLMPSRVRKLKSGEISDFLSKENATTKVFLFSKKGATSSIYKSLSTSFDDAIFAQVRNEVTDAVELFGVDTFPKLLVVPGGQTEPVVYDGEMKLDPMRKFIAEYATLLPEATENESSSKSAKEAEEAAKKKAAAAEAFLQFDKVETAEDLASKCLSAGQKKSCVLAPAPLLTDLNFKVKQKEFKFVEYAGEAAMVLQMLSIPTDEVVFINGKKGWYIVAEGSPRTKVDLQDWIDRVKAGDLASKKQEFVMKKDEL